MKNMLVAMLAVAFISTLTGTSMAAGPKPPKDLCFQAVPNGGAFILGIKKGNKIVAGSTKIDMYTVQGIIGSSLPISGSGYMNGDIFIFQLNTFAESNISAIGAWSVVTEEGEMDFGRLDGGGFTSTEYGLVPCGDL